MRLRNKIALVTGSSRGIGAAIATRLAADGAQVVLHGSSPSEALDRTLSAIKGAGGIAHAVTGDLGNPDVPCRIVEDAFAIGGALDILVNNAAISLAVSVVDQTARTIDQELAVNVRAPVLTAAAFARLTHSTAGRVINISSIGARMPVHGRTVYSASKGALDAFTRAAALELGDRGITVNVVAPGTTVTDMYQQTEQHEQKDFAALFAQWTALKRPGRPVDIADIVAFVASDEARWLTGNILAADGGLLTPGSNIAYLS